MSVVEYNELPVHEVLRHLMRYAESTAGGADSADSGSHGGRRDVGTGTGTCGSSETGVVDGADSGGVGVRACASGDTVNPIGLSALSAVDNPPIGCSVRDRLDMLRGYINRPTALEALRRGSITEPSFAWAVSRQVLDLDDPEVCAAAAHSLPWLERLYSVFGAACDVGTINAALVADYTAEHYVCQCAPAREYAPARRRKRSRDDDRADCVDNYVDDHDSIRGNGQDQSASQPSHRCEAATSRLQPMGRRLASPARAASRSGQDSIFAWAFEHGCPYDASTAALALSLRDEHAFWALVDAGCPYDARAATAAMRTENLRTFYWLLNNGCECDSDTFAAAARVGCTLAMSRMRAAGTPWGQDAFEECVRAGSPDTLFWLLANGYRIDAGNSRLYEIAIDAGCEHMVVTLYALNVAWDAAAANAAARCGNARLLEWMRAYGCPVDTRAVLRVAADGAYWDVMRWAMALAGPGELEAEVFARAAALTPPADAAQNSTAQSLRRMLLFGRQCAAPVIRDADNGTADRADVDTTGTVGAAVNVCEFVSESLVESGLGYLVDRGVCAHGAADAAAMPEYGFVVEPIRERESDSNSNYWGLMREL
jgi:hypothetical protein